MSPQGSDEDSTGTAPFQSPGGQDQPATKEEEDDEEEEEAIAVTFLVHLSGEFGNNVFKIMWAWGISLLAEREFGLKPRLLYAEQRSRSGGVMGKARKTSQELQRCFPSAFGGVDFSLGNTLNDQKGYFHKLPLDFDVEWEEWLTIDGIRQRLGKLRQFLRDHPDVVRTYGIPTTGDDDGDEDEDDDGDDDQPPRLLVEFDSLVVYAIVNEFYGEVRDFFGFDDAECCGNETLAAMPGDDETVLHYRNFATEFARPDRQERLGFLEIDADRMAGEVLGNLRSGDKVALTGRNLERDAAKNTSGVYQLVEALKDRGFDLRFSPGSDPMADFCFLKSARKEMVGTPKSTYLQLAAYLAPPETLRKARFVQYVTPSVVERHGSQLDQFRQSVLGTDRDGSNNITAAVAAVAVLHENGTSTKYSEWTHPGLAGKIIFEEYY